MNYDWEMPKLIPNVLAVTAAACALTAADFRVGIARQDITPTGPIWMSGYANRNKPSEGILTRLHAKALAIEDNKKGVAVIVTTDLIGLPRVITDEIAARLQKAHGLSRAQILFNSSHTHTGPVVWPNLSTMYGLRGAEKETVEAYGRKLSSELYDLIGAALANRKPARLSFGQSSAAFAINRRQATPKGVRLGLNPTGPVDHSVPVIAVHSEEGTLQAVLFGYACHNTTLTGQHYLLSADYAGYAQEQVEKQHPGATAMFLLLCGGDQNPNPRSEIPHAEAHGKELAGAVDQALGAVRPVRAPIKSAFQLVDLRFAPHTREQFEKEATDANPHKARRAKEMIELYDERRAVRRVAYPVQAMRFGKELTILALGGEVVVDYALRSKKSYPKENLMVAGYSNDVMCYIPSKRVLGEGGYEAVDSMIYYGMPGPFADDVEEMIHQTIAGVMQRVGVKRQ
jgi:hypothetical protein